MCRHLGASQRSRVLEMAESSSFDHDLGVAGTTRGGN
jgi:hypothetical protein